VNAPPHRDALDWALAIVSTVILLGIVTYAGVEIALELPAAYEYYLHNPHMLWIQAAILAGVVVVLCLGLRLRWTSKLQTTARKLCPLIVLFGVLLVPLLIFADAPLFSIVIVYAIVTFAAAYWWLPALTRRAAQAATRRRKKVALVVLFGFVVIVSCLLYVMRSALCTLLRL